MTVVDLRERLAFGRWAVAIPTPRRASETVSSIEGRELHGGVAALPTWRLGVLDAVVALLVAAGVVLATGLGVADAAVWAAAWLLALRVCGAYARRSLQGSTRAASTVRASGWTLAATAVLALPFSSLPVADLAAATLVALGLTLVTRGGLADRLLGRASSTATRVLVRGPAHDVAQVLTHLGKGASSAFLPVAVQVTDDLPVGLEGGWSMAPRSLDLVDAAAGAHAEGVLLVGRQLEDSAGIRRLIWRLERQDVATFVVPFVADISAPEVVTLPGSGLPVLAFTGRDLGADVGVTKVVLDKALALMALVALAPVIALTALAVKSTSEGPVLFRQVRVGRGGREFDMLKFRTMVCDAEARQAEVAALNRHDGGTLFKIEDDPRITPVGRVLRKYSLDELPQLVNVLRGEMSLVGPRPPLPGEVANYPVDAHRRFCVRPGLTGLWQVSGRSDLDPDESMRLDLLYVEQWSPGLDVRILAKTPKAVVSGEGAY